MMNRSNMTNRLRIIESAVSSRVGDMTCSLSDEQLSEIAANAPSDATEERSRVTGLLRDDELEAIILMPSDYIPENESRAAQGRGVKSYAAFLRARIAKWRVDRRRWAL